MKENKYNKEPFVPRQKWQFYSSVASLLFLPFVAAMGYTHDKWHWLILGIIGFSIILLKDFSLYKKIIITSTKGKVLISIAIFLSFTGFILPILNKLNNLNLDSTFLFTFILMYILTYFLHKHFKEIQSE